MPTRATITLAPDLTITRMGLGAMRLTGPGVWGPPADPDQARAVVARALAAGVRHIDTAHAYGPAAANEVVADAVAAAAPGHTQGLVIATKVGVARGPSGSFDAAAKPGELREQIEANLETLRRDRLDLVYLRVGGDGLLTGDGTPFEASLGALVAMREEGMIGHLGLSGVTVGQLAEAVEHTPIVAVQNRFHLMDRGGADVLAECERRGIAFVPYFPLGAGSLVVRAPAALAWLLARSPVISLIPGTSRLAHLEENLAAEDLVLTGAELEELTSLAGTP